MLQPPMTLVAPASARRILAFEGLVLACALGSGAGGCGAVGDARARLEAFLRDDDAAPEPAKPAEPIAPAEPTEPVALAEPAEPAEPTEPAEPVVIARAGSGGAEVGSGGEGDGAGASTAEGEASDGGTTGPAPADADAATDTGLLPMSYAQPPDAPKAAGVAPGAPGGPAVVPPTPPAAPGGGTSMESCLDGEWDAEDLHTWFRRAIAEQAHGRPVRFRGESGRHRLRFEPGVLHGTAEHRRIGFEARLANVDIRYSVDVHGAFEATFRIESPDVLVVERPARSTLRVREVVRFSADKSEARALVLPVEGRWQASCSPGALELRLLEKAGPGPALRFVRTKP